MNNSPINSTINSTTVGELADATSLRYFSCYLSMLLFFSFEHDYTFHHMTYET